VTDPQALPQSPAAASQEFSTGDTLRRARESQGLSVADVANSLKLNPRQIDALESGRFDQLPGYAFTRGFLRNYARLLKLDAGPLLAGLQVPGRAELQELSPASNAQGDMPQVGRGRFRRSVIPGVLAALALFGVVVAGWYYDTQRKKPAEELVASLPAPSAPQPSVAEPAAVPPDAQGQAAATPQPADGATPPAATAPAAVPVPLTPAVAPAAVEPPKAGSDRLVFEFAQDAWIEIKDKNGKVVLSKLGKAGSREELDAAPPMSLKIGNSRYVKLERNGKPVDLAASTKVTVARLKLE